MKAMITPINFLQKLSEWRNNRKCRRVLQINALLKLVKYKINKLTAIEIFYTQREIMEIRRASSKDLESILKINENVYSGLDYLHIVLPEKCFPRHFINQLKYKCLDGNQPISNKRLRSFTIEVEVNQAKVVWWWRTKKFRFRPWRRSDWIF